MPDIGLEDKIIPLGIPLRVRQESKFEEFIRKTKNILPFQFSTSRQTQRTEGDDVARLDTDKQSRKVDSTKYLDYEVKVEETRKKYHAEDACGASLVRSIIDLRTAFITGEEISISSKNQQFMNWVEKFLDRNSFQSNVFVQAVKGAEISGQSLVIMKRAKWRNGEDYVKLFSIPYRKETPYRPVYQGVFAEEYTHVEARGRRQGSTGLGSNNVGSTSSIEQEARYRPLPYEQYTYVKIGGDDDNLKKPTSRTGAVLHYIDFYDTCLSDMRRLNYVMARITPVFEITDNSKASTMRKKLKDSGWKIGEAVVGAAKFYYAVPETGANDNLTNELIATIKSITSVTGVPVHWLGYTEILSNRSTAETLYDLIKNSTINDRSAWQDAVYDIICKAQEMYKNMGGEIDIEYDFKVTLPLIDFSSFESVVNGLSKAFRDGALSLTDYRSSLPNVDPIKTERLVEEELEDVKEILESRNVNNSADESPDNTSGPQNRETPAGDGPQRTEINAA